MHFIWFITQISWCVSLECFQVSGFVKIYFRTLWTSISSHAKTQGLELRSYSLNLLGRRQNKQGWFILKIKASALPVCWLSTFSFKFFKNADFTSSWSPIQCSFCFAAYNYFLTHFKWSYLKLDYHPVPIP